MLIYFIFMHFDCACDLKGSVSGPSMYTLHCTFSIHPYIIMCEHTEL